MKILQQLLLPISNVDRFEYLQCLSLSNGNCCFLSYEYSCFLLLQNSLKTIDQSSHRPTAVNASEAKWVPRLVCALEKTSCRMLLFNMFRYEPIQLWFHCNRGGKMASYYNPPFKMEIMKCQYRLMNTKVFADHYMLGL